MPQEKNITRKEKENMTLDIPIMNDDGSVKTTLAVDPAQAQVLLQFALNFLIATGLTAAYNISLPETATEEVNLAQMELPLSD